MFRAMATDIASNFAATGGVANVNRVLQIEFLDESRKIVGVSVHVVAVPWLAGPTMAATIVSDTAISS
jgi:hypothetical protein